MKNIIQKSIVMCLFIAFSALAIAAFSEKEKPLVPTPSASPEQPEELGKVHWLRSMGDALALSEKTNKPILILFQEIPGCSTCRNYGNNILSHPLVVEAIETYFVPLAIHNNKSGKDAKVLEFFKEPAWNNPVVRIVNENKVDLTPRVSGDYSTYGLTTAMLNALDITNRTAPEWLKLLQEESQAKRTGVETATLGMYCFWTGEKELGAVQGVVSTEAGFMNGQEVVRVQYDPSVVSYPALLKQAKKSSCASHVFSENDSQAQAAGKVIGHSAVSDKSQFRADKEPKYFLSHTHYKYIPMTALQAARANSLTGKGQSPDGVLSPRQVELAAFVKNNPKIKWQDAIGKDVTEAWGKVVQLRSE